MNLNSYINEYYDVIKNSNLFDAEWFCKEYSLDENVDPIDYYLKNEITKTLNPSSRFNTQFYFNEYLNHNKSTLGPLIHYILYGKYENKLPKPFIFDSKFKEDYAVLINSDFFDADWFCKEYSLDENVDPIMYYLEYGVEQNLNPSPNFDTRFYLENNPSIQNSNINPFVHYILYGKSEDRIPKLYEFSDFKKLNLKKSIRGLKDYIFLINDTNFELNQHYDENYISNFNCSKFIEDYLKKKSYFNENNINYFYFVVPDKSIICKNLLPFNIQHVKRNVDKIKFIPKFYKNLNYNHYWKNDSHINYEGGKLLTCEFLKYIDDEFSTLQFETKINSSNEVESYENSDLLSPKNWSYTFKERYEVNINKIKYHIPKFFTRLNIPYKFAMDKIRGSEYYFNPDSISKYKVIIFRDSSLEYLKYYLGFYFNEMFLYWDHLDLNKELIEWFNPDMVLEIRTERFLDNYKSASWI